jgi:hypothetical protein
MVIRMQFLYISTTRKVDECVLKLLLFYHWLSEAEFITNFIQNKV